MLTRMAGEGSRGRIAAPAVVWSVLALCGCRSPQPPSADGAAGHGDVAIDASAQGDPGDDAGAAADSGVICEPVGAVSYSVTWTPPTLLLLVDRSQGMNGASSAAGPSKWEQVQTSLAAMLNRRPGSVEWGLALFGDGDDTCDVTGAVVVPAGVRNEGAMLAGLGAAGPPRGAAPTAEALRAAGDYLRPLVVAGPKYVVLVTDGHSVCAGGGGPASEDELAVQAVASLESEGITTIVLGVPTSGDTTAIDTLNRLATAGGQPSAGAELAYLPIELAPSLVGNGDPPDGGDPCNVSLMHPPPFPSLVRVQLNGVNLPQDPDNGWVYGPASNSIVLTGRYCDELKTPTPGQIATLSVFFGCPGGPIP